jgi:hypothetical protein
MRSTILLLIGLAATTIPVHAQPLTKSECDEVVMAMTEISRAAAGMLIHVENMNVAPLRTGGDKVVVTVQRLEEARKNLISALSEFTLAAKEVGQAVPAAMCPQ